MKKLKYIVSLFILMGLTSCDFLEKVPHELAPENYFNNEAELQSFLTGVYSPLMQERFYGSAYPLDISGGDDLSFYQRSSAYSSMICATANSATKEITTYWRILYEGVNRANMLLENVDRNPEINAAVRARVKSEALFLRSFYYFHLVQGWGDVPFRLESTQSVEGLSIPRTNKEVIYDRIIADIIEALPNLRTVNQVKSGTISQSAAKGILARIYLFRAGEHYRDNKTAGPEVKTYFAEAKRWALELKESGLHDLVSPYNRIFLDFSEDKYNSTGVKESIWEVEEAGSRATVEQASGRIGNVIGFGSTNDYSSVTEYKYLTGMKNPGYGYNFIYASLKLYQMYEEEGDTVRGNWNIAPFDYVYATAAPKPVTGRNYFYGKKPAGVTPPAGMTYTEMTEALSIRKTRCAAKYRREYELESPKNKNYTPINFPILRYSDVLLMIAEAENEVTGDTYLAYECLNKVRNRAGLGNLSGLGKDGFRDAIKKERAMELCFEAIRRWDLIRWGDFYRVMTGMSSYVSQAGWNPNHSYAANYYKVSPAYNYMPIPDWEMSTNKAVTQNIGW